MSMDPMEPDNQIFESYQIAQGIHKRLRPQLQKTILKIRVISSDIHDLDRSMKKASIVTSSVRVASGVMTFAGILGAPFTFGGSLSLAFVGAVIGLGTEAVTEWKHSSEIKSKCDAALMLLEVCNTGTTELIYQTQKLHTRLPYAAMGAVAYKKGSVLATSMARNIPKFELISTKLGLMFGPSGSLKLYSATFKSTGETVSPMFANMVSGIARESLRFMGAAAAGFDVIKGVVDMVENVKALDQRELSDVVIALDNVANKMENEMKILDELYASDTPSSV